MIGFPSRLALIGLRGSGKTTFGRFLAQKLSLPFVDADQYLQEKAGKSITSIFQEKGQDWFRDLESECLVELAYGSRWVLGCGGGVVIRPGNRDLLKKRAFVIWMDAPATVLASRVFHDPASPLERPPLAGAPLGSKRSLDEITREMNLLGDQRKSWYQSTAHFRIDSEIGIPEDWFAALESKWKQSPEGDLSMVVGWK